MIRAVFNTNTQPLSDLPQIAFHKNTDSKPASFIRIYRRNSVNEEGRVESDV